VIKSRGIRWVEYIAGMEGRQTQEKNSVGKPEGGGHLEDLGIGGKII
jgi:hypothetical protein